MTLEPSLFDHLTLAARRQPSAARLTDETGAVLADATGTLAVVTMALGSARARRIRVR